MIEAFLSFCFVDRKERVVNAKCSDIVVGLRNGRCLECTCSHGVLEVLVVADGAQHQSDKHKHCQEVALTGRLAVVHHIEQQVDEYGRNKLAGIID